MSVTFQLKPPVSCLSFFHRDACAATLVRASAKPASKPETGPWKTSLLQTGAVTTETSTDHLVGRTTKGGEDPEQDCFLQKRAWPGCPHRGRTEQAGASLSTAKPTSPELPAALQGFQGNTHLPTQHRDETDYLYFWAQGFLWAKIGHCLGTIEEQGEIQCYLWWSDRNTETHQVSRYGIFLTVCPHLNNEANAANQAFRYGKGQKRHYF